MNYLLLTLFISISSLGYSHDYFFAFAEMQYNGENQRFEIAVRATGHDVEDYLKHLGHDIPKLEEAASDPIAKKTLLQLIQNEFQIKSNNKPLVLELIGFEINSKDEAVFYLTTKKIDKPSELVVTFNLMMSFFPEQQNKLTLFTQEGKEYYSFLQHEKSRILKFKDR